MPANPRGNSSRGSRYLSERLVGPGVINQNSYIDIAKSNLHIGDVRPQHFQGATVGSGTSGVTTISLAMQTRVIDGLEYALDAGDIVRLTNVNLPTSSDNGVVELVFQTAAGGNTWGSFTLPPGIHHLVIPPGESDSAPITQFIIRHSMTTGATPIPQGSNTGIRLEFIKDN